MSDSPARPQLNLVMAHALEARPLISALALKLVADRPYKLYCDDNGLQLILSGSGQLAAAAATAYLAGLQHPGPASAWLNIGICGHGRAELGSALLINKIRDAASGRCYYPTPLGSELATSELITVAEVESAYDEAAAYDMEGAGFWASAARFSGVDLVQCLKLVSDNPDHGVEKFEEQQVAGLMERQLPSITKLIGLLRDRAGQQLALDYLPAAYHELIQRLHFTASQRRQLQEQCRLYKANARQRELLELVAGFRGRGGDLLRQLQNNLENDLPDSAAEKERD